MLGSEVLDVAIGMCFIYLLFSLICSVLNELFEAFAKNRAADLERGIQELLSHQPGDTAIEELYNHPLIYCLYAGKFVARATKKWFQKGSDLPSYIPAANFALAILDLAVPGTETQISGGAGSIAAGQVSPAVSIEALRTGVLNSQILNAKTKRGIITLIDAAGGDLNKIRRNLENWYNNSMDRVSGWYKRRTQVIIAAIALTGAAAVNVDSIAIINAISTQKSVRDSLVSASEQYAKNGGSASGSSACANAEDPNCKLTSSLGQLKALGIPVGWTNEPFEKNNRGIPQGVAWLLKLVGWCITAFAACLGAPFWFDALNKIMIVRSTVKPHEKSREEKSKS
ncbi:MAG TPA: hypothetical protein VH351_11020 [Bryobacteraceae bacterium]|jgi:hypothetical protein|nr:hypothetical protein [Bryobacteraceae bacterium]